jgi:excisionase family DNA binding protein
MTLLDKKQAATALGVSPVTVDRLRQSGKLSYRKIGGLVRFIPEDLDDFIRAAASTNREPAGGQDLPRIGNRSDALDLLADIEAAARRGDLSFVIPAVEAIRDAVERELI